MSTYDDILDVATGRLTVAELFDEGRAGVTPLGRAFARVVWDDTDARGRLSLRSGGELVVIRALVFARAQLFGRQDSRAGILAPRWARALANIATVGRLRARLMPDVEAFPTETWPFATTNEFSSVLREHGAQIRADLVARNALGLVQVLDRLERSV